MKRILFLLTLSGMLFADQAFVITFGTENDNSHSIKQASGILGATDSLTYNIVSANSYHKFDTIVDINNTSSISVSLASTIYKYDYIETASGKITSFQGDDNNIISSIFGTALINGVLMTIDDSEATITINSISQGTYTLYALGARGSKGTTDAKTSYTLLSNDSINSLSGKILAHGQSSPEIENNVIEAYTFNNSRDASNWVLMEYNFDVTKDDTNIVFKSYGHSGNIAAIALVEHSTPEPTTTTLSLLALTALAARRRRK